MIWRGQIRDSYSDINVSKLLTEESGKESQKKAVLTRGEEERGERGCRKSRRYMRGMNHLSMAHQE